MVTKMDEYKVLVTGSKGQVGAEIVELLKREGFTVYGYGRDVLDVKNLEQVENLMHTVNPNVVIHSAAYTNVDKAESEENIAFSVNAYGTRNIAVASEQIGAKLVYLSTDFVFDGAEEEPYNEFTSTNPLSVYGKSKLAGEQFVQHFHSRFFIVRTSWVFGKYGKNFVQTMLQLALRNQPLTVVDDQLGSPTYAHDLAKIILQLIQTNKFGVYHVSNAGECSWFDFAEAIFKEANLDVTLTPCKSKDYIQQAQRPAYSVLDNMALRINGFQELRHWKEALKEYIQINKVDLLGK